MGSRSWFRIASRAGLLAATVLVTLLGQEVRSLRSDARLASQRQHYMHAGMYVPRLELTAPNGQRAIVGDPPARTREILFVFDTSCGFCRANVRPWNDIAEEAAERRFAAYGLSLDDANATAKYSADHSLRFPTLLLEGERAKALLRAKAVPQTIVVEPNGFVVLARPGVLSRAATDSILTLLPGGSSVRQDLIQEPSAAGLQSPISQGGRP
jgi:peroxiredoxin